MIERRDALAQVARSCVDWIEAQHRMALGLLGIPIALQAGPTAMGYRIPETGLEPARARSAHQPLKPARLPITGFAQRLQLRRNVFE
jgi:hypothetical protein